MCNGPKHFGIRFAKCICASHACFLLLLLLLLLFSFVCVCVFPPLVILLVSDIRSEPLAAEGKFAFIEMLQSHSWILESSMEDYHNGTRVRESCISVVCDMGNGMTGERRDKLSPERF